MVTRRESDVSDVSDPNFPTRAVAREVRAPYVTDVTGSANQVPDLQQDRARLLGYLDDLRESGRPVPCFTSDVTVTSCFVSDDTADQEYAARLCVGCAGRAACDRYGLTWPDEFGVYGGRTDLERRPRPGRPTKRHCDICNQDVANLPRHIRLVHDRSAA